MPTERPGRECALHNKCSKPCVVRRHYSPELLRTEALAYSHEVGESSLNGGTVAAQASSRTISRGGPCRHHTTRDSALQAIGSQLADLQPQALQGGRPPMLWNVQ